MLSTSYMSNCNASEEILHSSEVKDCSCTKFWRLG